MTQQLAPIAELKQKCLFKKQSTMIPKEAKVYMLRFIKKYSREFKSGFSNDIRFVLRQFFAQIKSSTYQSYKAYKYDPDPCTWASIQDTKEFLNELMTEISFGCFPGNNITRIMLYLDIIDMAIAELGLLDCSMPLGFDSEHCKPPEFPFQLDFMYTSSLIDNLLECLKSSFEIVRSKVLDLLISHFLDRVADKKKYILDEGKRLIVRARSNEAKSGASYLFLMNYLQNMESHNIDFYVDLCNTIDLMDNDLLHVCKYKNIEGFLVYFKQLVITKKFNLDLKDFLSKFKLIVLSTLPIVSSSCPEGNHFEHDPSVSTSQFILSFSWRVITLAASLIESFFYCYPNADGLDTFFSELVDSAISINHRGAFANVCPIFSTLTKICFQSENFKDFPRTILNKYLNEYIHHSGTITRRSAGIPQSIVALLVAIDESTCTTQVLKQLPNSESELSLIHSLNIMHAIYLESKLDDHVKIHVNAGMQCAIEFLSHSNWRIRNCALILFSTVIKRGFRDIKCIQKSISKAFEGNISCSKFACLLLLKMSKSPIDDYKQYLLPLVTHIEYRIRELAGELLGKIVLEKELNVSNSLESNIVHGNLLTILSFSHSNKLSVTLLSKLENLYSSCCDVNKSVIVRIFMNVDTISKFILDEYHIYLASPSQSILSAWLFEYVVKTQNLTKEICKTINNSSNSMYKERLKYIVSPDVELNDDFFNQVPFERLINKRMETRIDSTASEHSYEDILKQLNWSNEFTIRMQGALSLHQLQLPQLIYCLYYVLLDEEPSIRDIGIDLCSNYITIDPLKTNYDLLKQLIELKEFENHLDHFISEKLKGLTEKDSDALFPVEHPNVYFEYLYFFKIFNHLPQHLLQVIPNDKSIRNDLLNKRQSSKLI